MYATSHMDICEYPPFKKQKIDTSPKTEFYNPLESEHMDVEEVESQAARKKRKLSGKEYPVSKNTTPANNNHTHKAAKTADTGSTNPSESDLKEQTETKNVVEEKPVFKEKKMPELYYYM
eukprot:TRINITY_DN30535_c0_g1_i1.p2 TRINITY_DN30535_c0_g1~~TRINITY_DN30535_c0_g1_i1.p2  ORF type:complete len:120 (+),score=40.88 TRINITY_DN30535_c0_g1_i1:64-423(+)